MRTKSAWAAALCCVLASQPAASEPGDGGEPPRVVVLGFDGADGRTVAEMMQRDALPNLARLAEAGTFAALRPTNPVESPAAWAALNCGRNPAETGVPGFIKRDLTHGMAFPAKGLSDDGVPVPREELELPPELEGDTGELPPTFPVVKNPLATPPFWELAAASGVPSIVLGGAQAWDREQVEDCEVLWGLGIPDANGDYISYSVYTADELYFERDVTSRNSDTGSGGKKVRVDARNARIESLVLGPADFARVARLEARKHALKQKIADAPNYGRSAQLSARLERFDEELKEARRPLTLPLVVDLEPQVEQGGSCSITIGDQTQTVGRGRWSDWYHLTFELAPPLEVHAITRAKLVGLEPHFALLLDAIEIDPARPPFWQPLSQPQGFAPRLAESGPFSTVGWSALTHPYKDRLIDEATLLEDAEHTLRRTEARMFEQLARDDWRLHVSVFHAADHVQHALYHLYDEQHPLHDPEVASRSVSFLGEEIELRDAIPAVYREIDRIVGRVLEQLEPQDTLLIVSDHGFQSFRRQVHVNNWLIEAGYLVPVDLGGGRNKFVHLYVDWGKTRAYAMGLGVVYLNLEGREPSGIVAPDAADELLREIRTSFLALRDPLDGSVVGNMADITAEVHAGPYLGGEADLLLGFAPGYRVSWQTGTGGVDLGQDGAPGPILEDNDRYWTGGHCSVDPDQVRGILFCNRGLDVPADGPDLLHVAPTVLALLGVPIPAEMDLPPLETTDN